MTKHFYGLLFISLCLSSQSFCQQESRTAYLNYMFQETTKKQALYIGEISSENGLCKLECRYKHNKRLAVIAHFLSSSLTTLEGPYTSYFNAESKQSEGNYSNGKMDGVWKYWNEKGNLEDSIVYKQNKKIQATYFYRFSNGNLSHETYTDKTSGIFKSITYTESGQKKREMLQIDTSFFIKTFLGNTIELDTFYIIKDTTKNKTDTTVFKHAEFQGGATAWAKFLMKKLNANTPIDNGAPEGTYNVQTGFIILKNGEVEGVRAETDQGYGTEREVIQLIYSTPNWVPATYKGKPANSYFKQPVTFIVQSN